MTSTHAILMLFILLSRNHDYLHSFPTRRSSDLLLVERPAVGDDATIGRSVTHAGGHQQRTVEPAAILIGAFEINVGGDRQSTRLNSSHRCNSYAVFCLKNKTHHAKACAG